MNRQTFWFFIFFYLCGVSWFTTAVADEGLKCRLRFTMNTWSVFYKSGKGSGTIMCENGTNIPVVIRSHGGGVSFGKSKIEGKGVFSKVDKLEDLFGSYASSGAHAGVSGSAEAQAMTKGEVSLSLSGSGKGFDLGFAFGSFKISPTK